MYKCGEFLHSSTNQSTSFTAALIKNFYFCPATKLEVEF